VIATANGQRWEHAEVLRVLLAEEAAGRDRATITMRRRAAVAVSLVRWRRAFASALTSRALSAAIRVWSRASAAVAAARARSAEWCAVEASRSARPAQLSANSTAATVAAATRAPYGRAARRVSSSAARASAA
jgi:hypothetical protein